MCFSIGSDEEGFSDVYVLAVSSRHQASLELPMSSTTHHECESLCVWILSRKCAATSDPEMKGEELWGGLVVVARMERLEGQ